MFRLSGGWVGLFARFAPCVVSVHMSGAAARGRALLAAPIAFHPKTQSSFPVQHSAVAFSAGFVLAFPVFLTWLFNLD